MTSGQPRFSLSISDVSRLTGESYDVIWDLCRRDIIPARQSRPGAAWRIREDVLAVMASSSTWAAEQRAIKREADKRNRAARRSLKLRALRSAA